MMSEFIEILRNQFLFKDLSEEQLEYISLNSSEVIYNKGDIIFKEGSYVSHGLYLVEGHAKIYIEKNNKTGMVKLVKPNWFIGLLSVFSYENYQFSASAIERCVVREIKIEILRELVNSNPLFAMKFLKEISLLSTDLVKYLVLKYQKNVRGRLADILLHLAENIYKNNSFPLDFTRKELGTLANTSTESIIRMLSDFKKSGLIDISDQKITIKNIQQLKKESEMGL